MAERPAPDRLITDDPDSVDDSGTTILHVDMDAFFASVELLRRPEVRGRPMMVAGVGGRGVVLSATYEARRAGVRSAMPTARAMALCPGLVVIPPDHAAYRVASAALMRLLRSVTPVIEPLSVDEAFLDVSGARRLAGPPSRIAVRLRERIRSELGLTATVGAASTKFVAKLASSLAKPDGLLIVPDDQVAAVLWPLPVRALWGVGPKTAQQLASLGLTTIGEIAATERAVLCRALGPAVGARLHDLAWGRDTRAVEPDTAEVSLGCETTFATDSAAPEFLARELLSLAERVGRRARSAELRGRTVAIKVRFADFTTVNRSMTLVTPTDSTHTIGARARELFARVPLAGRQVRLLGVRLEGLIRADQAAEQLELGAVADRPGWRAAEAAADRVALRYGVEAIRPATLLNPPGGPTSTGAGGSSRSR